MAVYMAYLGWSLGNLPIYAVATGFNLVLTVGSFYFAGLYGFETITAPYRQIHKILIICSIVFLLLVVIAFALKVSAQFSRVWSFSSFILEVFLICATCAYFHYLIKKWARAGRLVQRIAIVGASEQGERLAKELERQKEKNPWLRVTGIYDDRGDRRPAQVGTYPVIGNLDDLLRHAWDDRVDDILVALPWAAEDRLLAILQKLRVLPAHIQLGPDLIGHRFLRRRYNRIGDVSYLSIHKKPISDWSYLVKEIEDRVLGLIIFLLFAPLMMVIALAIKIDRPDPVMFKQERYGFSNKFSQSSNSARRFHAYPVNAHDRYM